MRTYPGTPSNPAKRSPTQRGGMIEMATKRVKIRIRVDECPFCGEENEVTESGFDICEHFVDFDFDNMEAIFESPKGKED